MATNQTTNHLVAGLHLQANNKKITIRTPNNIGADYSLILPSQVSPASGQPLVGDSSGNLSWGAASTPTGSVIAFAGSTATTGWLLCNGQAVSRTDYANLYNVIGSLYGGGDGSTTFNLPDLRGTFVRGFDNGRGIDANRSLGSSQNDAMQNVTGAAALGNGYNDTRSAVEYAAGVFYKGNQYTSSAATKSGTNNTASDLNFDMSRVARTANETRPINLAMNYIIKT